MHYYQFNIGDYLSHTRHLTPTEDLCYRRLLDYYYLHEKPISLNANETTRLICLNKEYLDDVVTVLNEFFVKTENGWINPRADKEIKQYQGFAEAGKRGADKRWSKAGDSPPISPPNQGSIANNNHKPLTINHKPLTNKKHTSADALDDGFIQFWNTYPKKIGKTDAARLWKKTKPNIDEVLTALGWQIKCEQWQRGFIPNPATYLNQGRWQDEPLNEGNPF